MATDRAPLLSPTLVKVALSAWLVFHLLVLVLVPNPENEIGRRLAPIIKPYSQFFELTNSWSFFAPEPGPPPVYVEYEVLDKQGSSIRRGQWPDETENLVFRDRLNRRIAAAEFMIASEIRAERMMLPYLCGKFPEARSIRVWRVAYAIPSLEGFAAGKEKIGDLNQVQRQLVSHSFCEDKK